MMRIHIEVCDTANAGTDDRIGVSFNRYFTEHFGNGVYYENAHYLRDSKGDFAQGQIRDFYLIPASQGIQKVSDLRYMSIFKQGSNAICLKHISVYLNESSTSLLKVAFSGASGSTAPATSPPGW
jgi:hypothetical protein